MTNFTTREREVLGLLEFGYSNREISKTLFISIHTTKAHLSNIFRKYGVTNRVQAVSRSMEEKHKNKKD